MNGQRFIVAISGSSPEEALQKTGIAGLFFAPQVAFLPECSVALGLAGLDVSGIVASRARSLSA